MAKNRLAFLKKAFPNDKVHIEDDGLCAIVFNPFHDQNVNVYYCEEDDYTPFLACFSYQHRHFSDEEDIIDWINDITTGRVLAIEFFKNGQNCFGGEITAEELDEITYKKLERYAVYYGTTKLLNIVDSFKIRGWNIESNFDAVFVLEKDGTIAIEKNKLQCNQVTC